MSVAENSSSDGLLFDGADWSFDIMARTYDAIERVALDDLGLDVYVNQVEIISSEQMLDAYASFGMPLMYRHWSFGKRFAREQQMYKRGFTGLAYEIVINSNPCISYNLEENTMAMQTLVMAHAAFGHNHFFKNNYLFLQWTDADGVLDYLQYAKTFVAKCEERHGVQAVEELLDAAHALMDQGVFRYRHDSIACQNQSGTEQTQAPFAPQAGHALFCSAINANFFVLSKCLSHFGVDHFGNSGHLHQF
jgi:spore cortex formation protein SpoVR/YcgB (stage V sporulation)